MGDTSSTLRGPTGFSNWRRAVEGEPARERYEFPLYSDSYITDEVSDGLGPYRLFNNLALYEVGYCRPVIILACDFHGTDSAQAPAMETDESAYHGGYIADELSALVGLAHGIRLRSSSYVRCVPFDAARRTRHHAEDPRTVPTLRRVAASVLPRLPGKTALTSELVKGYPALAAEDAVALVRAARLYQQALWTADEDTNFAWVTLVSAVEAAAVRWADGSTDSVSALENWRPDLARQLKDAGGDELVESVAVEISGLTQSTTRFVKFLLAFLPDPPQRRPRQGQVRWTRNALRPLFSKVYSYRSRALHAGIPFPGPMCLPPFRTDGDVPYEIPVGLAQSSSGATWRHEDTPVLFHAFEHIARGALTGWWRELCRCR